MKERVRPKLRDVRHIYNLLGECMEIGSNSMEWRNHLLEGVCNIIHARVGLYMHIAHPLAEQEAISHSVAHGFLDGEHLSLWEHYQINKAQRDDLFHINFFKNRHSLLKTRNLDSTVIGSEWRRSKHYNEYIRPCNLNDRITSRLNIGTSVKDEHQVLVFHRDKNDGNYSRAEKYLVSLLHHELSAILGKKLALPTDLRDTGKLPPRLLQVLAGIERGESEKRLAESLGLSQHTVNRHVQRLYRHYQVHSKTELLALLNNFNKRNRFD